MYRVSDWPVICFIYVVRCVYLQHFHVFVMIVALSRMKEERPRHPVHCDYIQAVAQAVSIPVIAK